MRKNQVLIVAVALFFCSAVAVQAQGIYEVFSIPVMPTSVREGGGAESWPATWCCSGEQGDHNCRSGHGESFPPRSPKATAADQ